MSENTVLLLPHQERFVQSPNLFPDIRWHFLLGGYGCGKALPVDTVIPTPDGYRRFGDIKVGDRVFAVNGEPTTVTGVFPQGMKDAYRVTFSDGRSAVCCKEHLWGVYYYSHSGFKYKVVELDEMLKKGVRRPDPRYTKAGGKPRYWIPASPVCYYPAKEVPMEPYVLGALIGNGCLTCEYLTMSSNDEWQVAKVASILGFEYKRNSLKNYNWTFKHDGHLVKTADVVPRELCCLAGDKFIPDVYKVSDFVQRKALLQGLFDTDGSVDNSGNRLHVTYSTTSKRLAEDVREVLLSLGIVSTIRLDRHEGKNDCYSLSVNCAQEQKAWLFSLPRKLERITSFKRADKRDYSRVAIYSVEKLSQQMDMQCIMVDDPAHLFLTEEYIVTHNTRSLAISALKIIEELDGDKDEGGLYAKIIVAGYTYAHLEQTFLIDFRAYLENSKTPYHEDTKNHIFTVGTVQVVLVQLLEPGKIFGQSVYCALCLDGTFTKVLTKQMNGIILYKKLKDISVGDTVLTRYGWRKVIRHINQGKKKVIARRGLIGTPDHSVAAVGGYTELQDLKGQGIYSVSTGKVKLWEKTNQILKSLLQKQLTLTARDTTDILLVRCQCTEIISKLQTVRHCISQYGKKQMGLSLKDVTFITKTVTLSIMLLKTLSVLLKKSTAESTLSLAAKQRLESAQAVLHSLDAMYVVRYSQVLTSEIRIGFAQKDALHELGRLLTDLSSTLGTIKTCRNVSLNEKKKLVNGVENLLHLLPSMAGSVLNDAVMLTAGSTDLPHSKRKGTELLPVPYVAKSFRPVERILDSVHALVSTLSGGTREVYDITVEDCHEFLTSEGFCKNCDEVDELPEDVMIEAMKSVSQRVRQIMPNHRSPYIMSASTAQGMKGFYRLYCHYKKSGIGFVLTRARTQDNWYLPKEYILDLWKNFTETERKVYMEGAFLSVTQGRVIPGFDWNRNFAPDSDMDLELIPGERVYWGQDFNVGYNRGSAWVVRNGILHCIKYYDFPDPGDSPDVVRYDFPEQDIFWLPDVTIRDQYPHYARALRKNDIHIIHRSKSPLVEDSCFLISKLCTQGRIMIHSQAREVAEAFSTASRDKDNKIPKGVGPNSPIHAIDGARYVCSYLALILPEFKDIRKGIMSHLASFRAGAEEMEERLSAVGQIGAGYTRIEGRAFTENR